MNRLVRLALLAYPREFREQFGAEVLADCEGRASVGSAFDLVASGLAMRFDGVWRDVAYAFRRLKTSPLFVAIVVLTFALGIGANVAVFSVLDEVAIQPLPFPHPGSLAIVQSHQRDGSVMPITSLMDAADIRERAKTLQSVAAVASSSVTMMLDGRPYALNGITVMPNYVTMIGLRPQLGRLISATDAQPGMHSLDISDALWRKRFSADPSVIGKTVRIDGTAATIVGVLRPQQLLPVPSDEAIESLDFLTTRPFRNEPSLRGRRFAGTIVRLAHGVDLRQANADLAVVSERLTRLYPKTNTKWRFGVESFEAAVVGPTSSALWMIFAAVIGILLIACANVGNMLGARWSSRDREFAIRRALGASSARIGAQLLTETALLAFAGGIAGVALAYAGLAVIAPSIPDVLPYDTVSIDGWSLLYALVVVVLATFASGVSPLLVLRSRDLQTTLKAAGRGGDGRKRHTLRNALVIVEVALALALVVIGGLSVRNIVAIVNTPLGIRSDGVVVTGAITTPQTLQSNPQVASSAFDAFLRRLHALPGVERAAVAFMYPLDNMGAMTVAPVVGRTYSPGGAPTAWTNQVSPEYFEALGVRIISGRAFTTSDSRGAQPVVIVNKAFADAYLKGVSALGTQLRVNSGPTNPGVVATVVGVVDDERFGGLFAALKPAFYVPVAQQAPQYFSAVAYAPHVPSAVIGREIDDAFAKTFSTIEPPEIDTIAQRIAKATVPMRVGTMLAATLGAIALALACAGVFGVVSFSVTQRIREFGIRIALGARKRDVVVEVMRRSILTTAIGVAIGLLIAAFGARAASVQLSEVAPLDPLTFVVTIVLIFASSVLASLAPALRATNAQPADVLRYE